MRNCDTIISNFILVILVLWIASFVILLRVDKAEQIPTMTFSAIAAGFAYQAYKYTKEKFRLDLFEKRMSLYEDLYKEVGQISVGSQRMPVATGGINHNKFYFLFGKEIENLIVEINGTLMELNFSTYGDVMLTGNEQRMMSYCIRLPEVFASYLYFGDYKSDREQEKNLCELCVLCSEKFFKKITAKKVSI